MRGCPKDKAKEYAEYVKNYVEERDKEFEKQKKEEVILFNVALININNITLLKNENTFNINMKNIIIKKIYKNPFIYLKDLKKLNNQL